MDLPGEPLWLSYDSDPVLDSAEATGVLLWGACWIPLLPPWKDRVLVGGMPGWGL